MRMYRNAAILIALLALVMTVGCASVATTDNFNGLKLSDAGQNVIHVNGSASGLYLLWIPLITGNTDKPESWIPVFIKDTVNLDNVAGMISKEAKGEGATHLLDVPSSRSGMLLPIMLPIFFWKNVTMCGNGVK